jgi:hypothetical protein
VASEGAQEKKQTGKGFAGLDTLLSDVDDAAGAAGAEASTRSPESIARPSPARPARRRAPDRQPGPAPAQQQSVPQSSASSGGRRLLKWGGLALVIYLFWLGSSSNSPSPRREYPQPSAKTGLDVPTTSQTGIDAPTTSAITEERPPVGSNLVLGPAQIRYCVSEKIRLEGADKVVNVSLESDVNRFNAMVDDYNSRCGAFRYRSGSLESAKTDIERIRLILEAEGRSRFSRSPAE